MQIQKDTRKFHQYVTAMLFRLTRLYFYLLLLTCSLYVLLSQQVDAEMMTLYSNVDKRQTALKGFDPVSYFSSVPVPGRKDVTLLHRGIRYRFASKENLREFQLNPAKYIPAFGGWCAWAMLDGKKVDINPERYKIIGNKVYLFYDGFWGNTLKKWNSLADKVSEQTLIEQAEKQWQKIAAPGIDGQGK